MNTMQQLIKMGFNITAKSLFTGTTFEFTHPDVPDEKFYLFQTGTGFEIFKKIELSDCPTEYQVKANPAYWTAKDVEYASSRLVISATQALLILMGNEKYISESGWDGIRIALDDSIVPCEECKVMGLFTESAYENSKEWGLFTSEELMGYERFDGGFICKNCFENNNYRLCDECNTWLKVPSICPCVLVEEKINDAKA